MGEGGGDEEEDGESDQEHDGESCAASTSELVQWSGQLQTTVVTLLLSAKLGDMSTASFPTCPEWLDST